MSNRIYNLMLAPAAPAPEGPPSRSAGPFLPKREDKGVPAWPTHCDANQAPHSIPFPLREGWRGTSRGRIGFTLIELLVVIALTLTLITLLFGPLISGFQTTSQAQTQAQANDSSRLLLNLMSRELASAVAIRDTKGGNLNMLVMVKANPGDATGTEVLAHMPGGYTDIVPPQRLFQNSASIPASVQVVTDPTTGRNLVLEQKQIGPPVAGAASQTLVPTDPDLVTPIAPDNSIVRYFIGLKYPFNLNYSGTGTAQAQPYTNIYDGEMVSTSDTTYGTTSVVTGQLNNTYILYRASVNPYLVTSGTPSVNSQLFDTTTDSQGNSVPVLDDPDFFRIVTDSDPLPVTNPHFDPAHATGTSDNTYGGGGLTGASLTAAHNTRVYYWYKAAQPLINAQAVDLLAYLRPGNQLSYNQITDANGVTYYIPSTHLNPATGVGTTSFDTDGVTPIVPSTITITPGGTFQEPALAQQTSDLSQGVPATNIAAGYNYLPAVFKTSHGQIQGYPTIAITSGAATYSTRQAIASDTTLTLNGSATDTVALSDLVETVGTSGAAVYDVTQGLPVTGATSYVAFAYDPTGGTINFAVSATPPANSSANANTANGNNQYWAATPAPVVPSMPSSNLSFYLNSQTVFPGNPLSPTPPATGGITPPTQIVVNSEEVMGPDKTPGPASSLPPPAALTPATQYSLVPYSRVSDPGQVGINQYYINYATGQMLFAPASAWGTDLTSGDPQKTTILVSYKYQNNNSGTLGSSPATVSVTYSSGGLVTISMGVRVYDTSTKVAAFFSQTNTVSIGNGSR